MLELQHVNLGVGEEPQFSPQQGFEFVACKQESPDEYARIFTASRTCENTDQKVNRGFFHMVD